MRERTGEGNGTTFDLQRLLMCEGGNRRVTRMDASGNIAVVAERYEGKRLNRPNDIICKSDGIYFTDPGFTRTVCRTRVSLFRRLLCQARRHHAAGG